MNDLIRVENLTKRFGSFVAVRGIDFSIRRGEILGFLGPNGAGKTTTIRMINGLLRMTAGTVTIAGLDIRRDRRRIKEMIGYMSQRFSLYPLLTGEENVEFFAGLSGLSRAGIRGAIRSLADRMPPGTLKQKVTDIPPGHRQQISLFSCLLGDPRIIFLDEPTSGVDPRNRRQFWQDIYALRSRGKTILVTTHSLDEAEYADRILIIHRGKIIERGEPARLCARYRADSIEEVFLQAVEKNETA